MTRQYKNINELVQDSITRTIDMACTLIATDAEQRKVFAQAVKERSHGNVFILTADELDNIIKERIKA